MRFYLLPIALLFVLASFIPDALKPKAFTLQEAIDHPDFDVTITSNGDYSGNSIVVRLKSNSRKDAEITIPAGLVFYTDDEGEQKLLMPKEEVLLVEKGRSKKKTLDGFCSEARDKAPSSEQAMKFEPEQREKLNQLVSFLKDHRSIDDHNIQEAVWAISDGHSVSNICANGKSSVKELKKLVAEITGQKIPWNETQRRFSRSSAGDIEPRAVMVKGDIEFSSPKEVVIRGKILGEDNEVLYTYPSEMRIPKTKKAWLEFKLEVEGWTPAKYFVVYSDQDGKEYIRKEFSI